MKDRLLLFMQAEQVTAVRLAEIIGVQPSSISHILSDRNKPGYDFLFKLFSVFPKLNPGWMILGTGNMYADQSTSLKKAANINLLHSAATNTANSPASNPPTKDIEKIIVFYTDNTFDSYTK